MKVAVGCAAILLMFTAPVWAQTPAAAPAGSTAQCKDGTYWSGKIKIGACRGHKGIQTWYGAAAAAPAASPAPAAAAPSSPAKVTKPAVSAPAASAPAAGGGAGQVWVNTKSKVYHCQGDRYYGKTKQGQYMSESAALAAGDRADHGKACH